jgi:hypothetical protein
LKSLPEGTPRLVRSRIVLGRVFIDTIPLQHEALQQILRDVHVDAIVADSAFLGVLPMPLGGLRLASRCHPLRHVRPALGACSSQMPAMAASTRP